MLTTETTKDGGKAPAFDIYKDDGELCATLFIPTKLGVTQIDVTGTDEVEHLSEFFRSFHAAHEKLAFQLDMEQGNHV